MTPALTLVQRLRRELSELKLAASIAARFGLMENAAILRQQAADLEARLQSTAPQTDH